MKAIWPLYHSSCILSCSVRRIALFHHQHFFLVWPSLSLPGLCAALGFSCVISLLSDSRDLSPHPLFLFPLSQWPCTKSRPFTISLSSRARAAAHPRRAGARRPCWTAAKRWVITRRHNHGDMASESLNGQKTHGTCWYIPSNLSAQTNHDMDVSKKATD